MTHVPTHMPTHLATHLRRACTNVALPTLHGAAARQHFASHREHHIGCRGPRLWLLSRAWLLRWFQGESVVVWATRHHQSQGALLLLLTCPPPYVCVCRPAELGRRRIVRQKPAAVTQRLCKLPVVVWCRWCRVVSSCVVACCPDPALCVLLLLLLLLFASVCLGWRVFERA